MRRPEPSSSCSSTSSGWRRNRFVKSHMWSKSIPLSLISFQRDKTISCVRCLRMRKPGKRIPAFMNSGKGFLPTKLTLSGNFVFSWDHPTNICVHCPYTTSIKYFNDLFSAKPMRRRQWESRSKSGTESTQARRQDRVFSFFWLLASAAGGFPRFVSRLASNCFLLFITIPYIPFACLESHTIDN